MKAKKPTKTMISKELVKKMIKRGTRATNTDQHGCSDYIPKIKIANVEISKKNRTFKDKNSKQIYIKPDKDQELLENLKR